MQKTLEAIGKLEQYAETLGLKRTGVTINLQRFSIEFETLDDVMEGQQSFLTDKGKSTSDRT